MELILQAIILQLWILKFEDTNLIVPQSCSISIISISINTTLIEVVKYNLE